MRNRSPDREAAVHVNDSPVTKSDASDARNIAAPAISSGVAESPAGVRMMISS